MKIAFGLGVVVLAAAAALSARGADPTLTLAGPGAASVVLLLAVAIVLAVAGATAWQRRPTAARGPLLIAAAVCWCAAQLTTPAAPTPAQFTAGLALGAAAPAAIALALVRARLANFALAVATVALLGVASALVFDPRASDCFDCPRNLLLVHGADGLSSTLQRAGLWVALAGVVGLLVSSARRPRLAPVSLYLLAVGAEYVASLGRGYLAADGGDRLIWALQGVALLGVAAVVVWEPVGERRARARVAELIVTLESGRGLREVLASVLGDPGLRLAYPLPDGRRLDASGRPVVPARGQVTTDLGNAELIHAPGVLRDPEQAAAIATAAGLSLRREALQAEISARLEDLRAVRARIVAAGDAERRRLERDLHDGAQQRLATLGILLAVARARASGDQAAAIDEAHGQVRSALAALRQVASGLVPPVLADEGLGPAVEAFAATADAVVALPEPLTGERFDPALEATAYQLLTETVRRSPAANATLRALYDGDSLRLSVDLAEPPDELVDLSDRVGALGGTLQIEQNGTGAHVIAVLPCA